MAHAIAKRFGHNRENWPPGLFADFKQLTVMDPTLLAGNLAEQEQAYISCASTEAEGEWYCECVFWSVLQLSDLEHFLPLFENTTWLERMATSLAIPQNCGMSTTYSTAHYYFVPIAFLNRSTHIFVKHWLEKWRTHGWYIPFCIVVCWFCGTAMFLACGCV